MEPEGSSACAGGPEVVMGGAGVVGPEKERGNILEGIYYFGDFLRDVASREVKLSHEAKCELVKLKLEFDKVLHINEIKEEPKITTVKQEQGAVPKRRTRRNGKELNSSDASDTSVDRLSFPDMTSSSTTSIQSESSNSSSSDTDKGRKFRRKHRADKETEKEIAKLRKIGRDTRQAPTMANFDEESGMDLKQYLKQFEIHCRINFRGLPRFWEGELESKLSGNTLAAFKSVRTIGDSWETLTKKLIRCYEHDKIARKIKFQEKFKQAKHIPGESMFLLATRLEKIFRAAHPSKCVNNSKTLRDKFIEVAPSRYQSIIHNQIVTRKMKNKRVTWEHVKKIATFCEAEKKHKRKDEPEEIIINVGSAQNQQTKRNRDTPEHTRGNNSFPRGMFKGDYRTAGTYGYNQQEHNFIRPPVRRYEPHSFMNQFRPPPPPEHVTNNMDRCSCCNKPGHTIEECKIRLNACFKCGSQEHYIRNCPHRPSQNNNGRRFSETNSGPNTHLNPQDNMDQRVNNNRAKGNHQVQFQPSYRPSYQEQRNPYYTLMNRNMQGNGRTSAQREVSRGAYRQNPPMSE